MTLNELTNYCRLRLRERGVLLVPAIMLLAIFGTARAELPPPTANMELIPAGSLIIPMDNTKQSIGADFNLQAYGMVNSLLSQNIRVKWAIRTGKAKDGIDLSHFLIRPEYPTTYSFVPENSHRPPIAMRSGP